MLCPFDITAPGTSDVITGLTSPIRAILINVFDIGIANIRACQLPSAWKKVERLSFTIDEASLLNLWDLPSRTGLRVGSLTPVIDDFTYEW